MGHECDALQGYLFSRPVPEAGRAAAVAQAREAIEALHEATAVL